MQTDQKRVKELLRRWNSRPKGGQVTTPHDYLTARIVYLLSQVRTEAYDKGYDDGFSDGISSEGL